MICLITEESAVGDILNAGIGIASKFVPQVNTANQMIGIVTGKDFGSPSPMLALADALEVALPEVKRVVFGWDARPDISTFDPADEPLLIVAHSFGGDTAVNIGGIWCTREVHLILIDPVRHGVAGEFWAQFGARPFHVSDFVASCTCYLRGSFSAIPPWHSRIDEVKPTFRNHLVQGADHNSIVGAVTPKVLAKAMEVFAPVIG